jgi:hypothetical protein
VGRRADSRAGQRRGQTLVFMTEFSSKFRSTGSITEDRSGARPSTLMHIPARRYLLVVLALSSLSVESGCTGKSWNDNSVYERC